MRIVKLMKLVKYEIKDVLRNPAILILILLPVLMSKIILGIMIDSGQDLMLLSTWILFSQVIIGIMVIGPNMIEERETKTIDALLLSPLNFTEIIIAKGLTVLTFSLISQLIVLFVNEGMIENFSSLFFFMILGGIFFIKIGLIIGLTMPSSKNGTAVSSVVFVLFYLIGTIYSALPEWQSLLRLIPSVQIVEIMQSILNNQQFGIEVIFFMVWMLIAALVIRTLIKK